MKREPCEASEVHGWHVWFPTENGERVARKCPGKKEK